MKKLIKYFLFFLLAVAILKNCGNPKKQVKKSTDNNLPTLTSDNVVVTINYNKQRTLLDKHQLFGLNTGFIWTREVDKEPSFVELLKESNNQVLRFPGGGVANNYHPNGAGYGYNPKKYPIGFKLMTIYNQTKDRKYNILDNFVSLCKQTNAKAIYCVNVFDGTVDEMIQVIDRLKQENIELLGVELGNEFNLGNYRHVFPNGQVYLDKIKKFSSTIREKYPDLKIGLVAEGITLNDLNTSRGTFMDNWNKTISKVDFDAYIVHSYLPVDDKQKSFDDIYLNSLKLSNPYQNHYTQNLLAYFKTIDKDDKHKIWLTEWNIFNAFIGNTFYQAAFVAQFLNHIIQYDTTSKIDIACMHDIGAMIGFVQSKQHNYTKQLQNHYAGAIYFPYKFLADIIIYNKANLVEHKSNQSNNSSLLIQTFFSQKHNKTYIYFVNTENKNINLSLDNHSIKNGSIAYIYAETLYGNAGTAAFLKEYPTKNNLIQYKEEQVSSSINIKPYSLGVIEF